MFAICRAFIIIILVCSTARCHINSTARPNLFSGSACSRMRKPNAGAISLKLNTWQSETRDGCRRNHENLFKLQSLKMPRETMKPFSSHNLSSNDLLDEKCNTNSILSCQHDAVSICSTYKYLQLLPLSIELNCSFSNFRNHLKTFCVSDPNHHPQVKKDRERLHR